MEKRFCKKIGELDRRKVAKIVFSNKAKKEKLDMLTLEYIVPKIKEEANKIARNKIAIIDAPLLFETGLDKFCDFTIGIIAKEETCIERICKRDGIDKKDAEARIDSQNKMNYFKIKCDYLINNEEGNDLTEDIEEIFERKKLI